MFKPLSCTLSVHSDRGTLSYKTRTKALRSGNHGPRARTPADRSRTSAGRTWASTSGNRTSRRPESSSQPGASLGTSGPRSGRGPEPPRAPVGAAADPRVRCRHVSHRRESSASSQPSCRIKWWWLRRALPEQGMGRPLTDWTGTNDNKVNPPVTEAARQLPRQALKTQRRAHGRWVMMISYWLEQQCMLLQWTEFVVRRFIMTSTRGCRG